MIFCIVVGGLNTLPSLCHPDIPVCLIASEYKYKSLMFLNINLNIENPTQVARIEGIIMKTVFTGIPQCEQLWQ